VLRMLIWYYFTLVNVRLCRVIQVFREGVALSSGDLYNPGEILSVSMSSTAGQQLLEVSGGAQFSGGSCDCSCR
jgi:hypothetical protein